MITVHRPEVRWRDRYARLILNPHNRPTQRALQAAASYRGGIIQPTLVRGGIGLL